VYSPVQCIGESSVTGAVRRVTAPGSRLSHRSFPVTGGSCRIGLAPQPSPMTGQCRLAGARMRIYTRAAVRTYCTCTVRACYVLHVRVHGDERHIFGARTLFQASSFFFVLLLRFALDASSSSTSTSSFHGGEVR